MFPDKSTLTALKGRGFSRARIEITNTQLPILMKVSLHARRPAHRHTQRGYILITLLLFSALLAISLLAMLPQITQQIKRDREDEMIHRGVQYSRAIKHYVKKFGRYPTRIEDLENTNNLRFLRKRYKDPLTGKDFKILRMGDVQLGLMGGIGAMPGNPAAAVAAQSGAFGNSALGGNGAFGGNSSFGNGAFGGNNSSFGGNNSTFGGGNNGGFGGNSAFGGGNSAFGGGNSAFGGNSSFGGNGGAFGGNSAFGGSAPGGNTPGTSAATGGTPSPAPGSETAEGTPESPDQNASGIPGAQPGNGQAGAQPPGSPQAGAAPGQGNQVFGGGPMVGVASTSKDKTIRIFNKKQHYNEWQFIYDPTSDRGGLLTTPYQPGLQSVVGANPQLQGAPGTQGGAQGINQNSAFGSQSSFGSQSTFGAPGGQQQPQPNPQQPGQPQQPEFPPDQGP